MFALDLAVAVLALFVLGVLRDRVAHLPMWQRHSCVTSSYHVFRAYGGHKVSG